MYVGRTEDAVRDLVAAIAQQAPVTPVGVLRKNAGERWRQLLPDDVPREHSAASWTFSFDWTEKEVDGGPATYKTPRKGIDFLCTGADPTAARNALEDELRIHFLPHERGEGEDDHGVWVCPDCGHRAPNEVEGDSAIASMDCARGHEIARMVLV
jgi:hypothetical protein